MPTIDPKHVSDDVRALNPQLFGKEEAAQAAPSSPLASFNLTLPPSANRYWRYTDKGPRRSWGARAWIVEVHNQLRGMTPAHGKVSVTVRFYGLPGNADLDNRIKVLIDGIKDYAFADDVNVYEIHASRFDYPLRLPDGTEMRGVNVIVRELTFNGKPATYSDGGVEDYGGPQADERGVPSNLPVLREPDT